MVNKKHSYQTIKCLKQFLLLFPFLLFANAAYAMAPRVTLVPAVVFDKVCTQKLDYKIQPSWRKELDVKLPLLSKQWDKQGNKLLNETILLIGKPFTATSYRVALSLCNFPSMSDPLMVNMRYSLNSFTTNALPSDVTMSIIYHELLHVYLDNIIPKSSPLLKKYSNESDTVKEHLHLFALMKAVYLKLNMQHQLDEVIKKDDSLPNHDYKKTWEIINGKEGYQPFIAELKSKHSLKRTMNS